MTVVIVSPKALGRCSATCGPFRRWHHAARAKFLVQSVSTNPSAKSLNSVGKASCESATIVVAVCEDGSPLASFEAKPRSNSILALSVETTLSTGLYKVIADKTVSRLIPGLFWRYQVARLIPLFLHGWVADRDSDCGRIPAARRLRSR